MSGLAEGRWQDEEVLTYSDVSLLRSSKNRTLWLLIIYLRSNMSAEIERWIWKVSCSVSHSTTPTDTGTIWYGHSLQSSLRDGQDLFCDWSRHESVHNIAGDTRWTTSMLWTRWKAWLCLTVFRLELRKKLPTPDIFGRPECAGCVDQSRLWRLRDCEAVQRRRNSFILPVMPDSWRQALHIKQDRTQVLVMFLEIQRAAAKHTEWLLRNGNT